MQILGLLQPSSPYTPALLPAFLIFPCPALSLRSAACCPTPMPALRPLAQPSQPPGSPSLTSFLFCHPLPLSVCSCPPQPPPSPTHTDTTPGALSPTRPFCMLLANAFPEVQLQRHPLPCSTTFNLPHHPPRKHNILSLASGSCRT